jgi:acetyl-CoA synthetase
LHSEKFEIGLGNNDSSIRNSAKKDSISFWGECAKSLFWFEPWSKILQWNPPFAKWVVG